MVLVIRTGQLERMGEQRFIQRMRSFMNTQFPEYSALTDAGHEEKALKWMAQARNSGLKTERQLAVFMVAAWLWETQGKPDIHHDKLLSDQITPDQKIQWLNESIEFIMAGEGY